MQTSFTRAFGVEWPIVQAGMGGLVPLLAGLDTVLASAAQRIEASQRQMAAPEARAA